jgi:hypothetical protein
MRARPLGISPAHEDRKPADQQLPPVVVGCVSDRQVDIIRTAAMQRRHDRLWDLDIDHADVNNRDVRSRRDRRGALREVCVNDRVASRVVVIRGWPRIAGVAMMRAADFERDRIGRIAVVIKKADQVARVVVGDLNGLRPRFAIRYLGKDDGILKNVSLPLLADVEGAEHKWTHIVVGSAAAIARYGNSRRGGVRNPTGVWPRNHHDAGGRASTACTRGETVS